MDNTMEWVQKAYKKLKGAVYFDKTQLPLVNQIVEFEKYDIDSCLEELAGILDSKSDSDWSEYTSNIIKGIDALVYPKKLKSLSNNQIIFNINQEQVEADKMQYFIEMPIIGHIIGVLWVITVGIWLDMRSDEGKSLMYEHSYGNRLRKNLYNTKTGEITESPYLFEPYFSQYESWRDKALNYAKERLSDNQDVLILTLDLSSFFYSVHVSEEYFEENVYKIAWNNSDWQLPPWTEKVNKFVYEVMKKYSEIVRTINNDSKLILGERVFLPIGFLPSNILSNWILTPFDKKICERVNPVYYGRYVDDIIIVDKIEKSRKLQKDCILNNVSNSLSIEDVIENYFCSCQINNDNIYWKHANLFIKNINDSNVHSNNIYKINSYILFDETKSYNDAQKKNIESNDIKIQNDKVKVFYFKQDGTNALLDCFQNQIAKNASEFRYLPDIDFISNEKYCIDIFKICSHDTINKINSVSRISLDKYSLSKFLGKYRKVGKMIHDNIEKSFDKKIVTLFDSKTIIENYGLWERLLEILIINNEFETYIKLVEKIFESIKKYQSPIIKSNATYEKRALILTVYSAICRTTAVCWGLKMKNLIKEVERLSNLNFKEYSSMFSVENIDYMRKSYCNTCMVNKYIISLPINSIKEDIFATNEEIVNLCYFSQCSKYIEDKFDDSYSYYPYIVTPEEISYYLASKDVCYGGEMTDAEKQCEKIYNIYQNINSIKKDFTQKENNNFSCVKSQKISSFVKKSYCIKIAGDKKKNIKVAIGNARLYEKDFENALIGFPNRSMKRYEQLSKLLREALYEKVDLLVLPENYLPWEWIPDVLKWCSKNQIAVITGIEHILSNDKQKVYNLTAVILPYIYNECKYSHVVYHHKTHYSPEEKRVISGYNKEIIEGNCYELFCWKDIWFSVYCCFELASIIDRTLFQSYVDLTIAVEWNHDISYFENIIGSLTRDLHCYCIQANTSDYGDSRVISPSQTIKRDIIKTKGGVNYTILADKIDIEALRCFQIKNYELQRDDKTFKPTPPDFDSSITKHKIHGDLWQYLKNRNNDNKIENN